MTIENLTKEFILDCKVRNLSPRTVHNYEKQLAYFIRFLKETEGVKDLDELKPVHVKQFIVMLQEKKNKPSYVNDLLKAVKVLCRYAYEENYTAELITKKVKKQFIALLARAVEKRVLDGIKPAHTVGV